jgi:hypothetical protein
MIPHKKVLYCILSLCVIFSLQIFSSEKETCVINTEASFYRNHIIHDNLTLYNLLIAEKIFLEKSMSMKENENPSLIERRNNIDIILDTSEIIFNLISSQHNSNLINPYLKYKFLETYSSFSITKQSYLKGLRKFKKNITALTTFLENYIKNEYTNLTQQDLSFIQNITNLNNLVVKFDLEKNHIININSYEKFFDTVIHKPLEFLQENKKYICLSAVIIIAMYVIYKNIRNNTSEEKMENLKNVDLNIEQEDVCEQKGLTCGLHALKNAKLCTSKSKNKQNDYKKTYLKTWEKVNKRKNDLNKDELNNIINSDKNLKNKKGNIIIVDSATYLKNNIKDNLVSFSTKEDSIPAKINRFKKGEPLSFIINMGEESYLDDSSWMKRIYNFFHIPLGNSSEQKSSHWIDCTFERDKDKIKATVHDSLGVDRKNCKYLYSIAKMLQDEIREEGRAK